MAVRALLLVLDDDRERLRGFDAIAARLGSGWAVKSWRDAPGMLAEIDRHLAEARLISLDHDLYRDSPSDPDPGTGRLVAEHLAKCKPACPVIVHTTNTDAAWGMRNVLSARGWRVELVHHLGQPAWIEELWLPAAKRLVSASGAPWPPPAVEGRPAVEETLTLAEYRALARTMPLPSSAQLREFAGYVAEAHSWYKHLRLLPARAPIQIFLDPAAGMQLVQDAQGRVSAAVREKPGLHYSWLPTAQHRQRFGHLAFSRSSGTSVSLVARDGSRAIGSDDAPGIYDPVARALRRLPEEVLAAGRAYIGGIVHRLASSNRLWQDVIARQERFDDLLERTEGLELAKRILQRCGELKADPACAKPAPPNADPSYAYSLAAFDARLDALVLAERQRQLDGLVAAGERLVRLVSRA